MWNKSKTHSLTYTLLKILFLYLKVIIVNIFSPGMFPYIYNHSENINIHTFILSPKQNYIMQMVFVNVLELFSYEYADIYFTLSFCF